MFSNRLLFALVCLPLLFNCAGHRQTDIGALTSLAHNLIPVYRTGFDVKEDNDGLIIEDFDAESPAIAVGMQKGDLIVSINGKAASRKEFLRVMQLNRGEDVLFTVKRCDQPIDFTITPKLYYNAPPSAYKVYELSVIDDRHVNLAVIVADVRNNTGEQSFSWEESMRHQVQQDIENNMLNNLDCQDNLSFADGAGLDEIIDAYRLNG
jgi:membrane-associated protease RseP (regulator of RpoE activity)